MLAPAAVAPSRWIGGAAFDAFFFFGSAIVALAVGLLMLSRPSTVLPLWFAWIWLVEGPHLCATWQRTYLDAGFRGQRTRLLVTSLLWLVPGPALLAVSWLSGRPEPFQLFLGAVALWAFHHTVRQHYGILSIYQRLGQADAAARKFDGRLLQGILWGTFGFFLVAHPTNRSLIGIGPLPGQVLTLCAVLLALAVLAWTFTLLLRWRRGIALAPGMFGLVVACGTLMFSMLVVGMHEPLVANPLTPEHVFMAATLVGGIVHGLQYIGIVIATEKRRAQAGHGRGTLAARMGDAPMIAYLVMLAVSLLYVALNVVRGGAPVGAAPETMQAQVFLALYWGMFCHHFWLDNKIWRPSSDQRLRNELGLETP